MTMNKHVSDYAKCWYLPPEPLFSRGLLYVCVNKRFVLIGIYDFCKDKQINRFYVKAHKECCVCGCAVIVNFFFVYLCKIQAVQGLMLVHLAREWIL